MRKFFLTFGYVGCIKYAPGTFGTIAAIPFAMLVLFYIGDQTLFLLAIFLGVVGISEINKYEQITNTHDDKSIVIDEVAGVFFALSIYHSGIVGFLLSVIFFRVFDILKPSIIGKVDKKVKGGLGVMLDDVLAGFFAGLLSHIICQSLLKIDSLNDIKIFSISLL